MLGVVPVLSALLLVLGALELLYAVAVGGVLTAGVFVQAGSGLPAELAGQIIAVAIFAGVGFIGLLRIAAAVGGLKYRGWGTMMTACCLGLATVLTCYCAPFSLVVGVRGVVVLADSHVRRAFAMAQDGTSPADIRRIITGQS